jgi:hypothetical protein
MNTKTYYGRIRLKSGGFPIKVSIGSLSNQQAKRAIEAQYGDQFKSWDRQMSTQPC